MEPSSTNNNTVDSFDWLDAHLNLDFPFTPRTTKIPPCRNKIKGKSKVAASIAGDKPSTSLSGAGDSMEMDGRDDVVREISVFCGSGNLGEDNQLFVMQDVLKKACRSCEFNKECEEVRFNPEPLQIELDLRIERDNENYDQEISKPLYLQKQTLSSTMVSSHIQYAIGFLEKNKFHLNPVHAILQLRPTLHDPEKKKFVSKTAEASSKSKKPWILLEKHSIDSFISSKIRRRMASEEIGDVQFMMRQSDYLNFVSSGKLAEKKVSGVPSMWALRSMPLEERLKKWFCERNQVNTFDVLKHIACGYPEDDLLKLLPSYANLVRGLWVCKSSLLYGGTEAMQRDYILLLFNRMDTIQYHRFKEIKDSSEFKSMMGALAYDRKLLGDWKFKQSADLAFIKRYPIIVQELENAWLDHEKIIMDSFKAEKKFSKITRKSLASDFVKTTTTHKEGSPFTNRDRDAFESFAGQSISSVTLEHLPKALLEIFNDKKVCSFLSIVQRLREMALSKSSRLKEDSKTTLFINAAANALSAPREKLFSVIDQVAVCIHGVYVLKSAANPAFDPLRNVVINLFQGKEPNAKLRKQEIKQAAQISLKRDITDSEYDQVKRELCISKRSLWELKNGD